MINKEEVDITNIPDVVQEWNRSLEPPQRPANQYTLAWWYKVAEELREGNMSLVSVSKELNHSYVGLYGTIRNPKFRSFYHYVYGEELPPLEGNKKGRKGKLQGEIEELKQQLTRIEQKINAVSQKIDTLLLAKQENKV